jgi:hypothetical protein
MTIRVILDGPPAEPGNEGRFVEVEDTNGNSIRVGRWVKLDGDPTYWALELAIVDA